MAGFIIYQNIKDDDEDSKTAVSAFQRAGMVEVGTCRGCLNITSKLPAEHLEHLMDSKK